MHTPSGRDWKHAALRWQKEVCIALGIPISPKKVVLATIHGLRSKKKGRTPKFVNDMETRDFLYNKESSGR